MKSAKKIEVCDVCGEVINSYCKGRCYPCEFAVNSDVSPFEAEILKANILSVISCPSRVDNYYKIITDCHTSYRTLVFAAATEYGSGSSFAEKFVEDVVEMKKLMAKVSVHKEDFEQAAMCHPMGELISNYHYGISYVDIDGGKYTGNRRKDENSLSYIVERLNALIRLSMEKRKVIMEEDAAIAEAEAKMQRRIARQKDKELASAIKVKAALRIAMRGKGSNEEVA